MQVRVKGSIVSFESLYTSNADALAVCKDLPSTFARDLAMKAVYGLSEAQWAWVHKLATDAKKPTVGVDADLTGLVSLFDTAGARLKRPKITFDISGTPIQLSVAGSRSRFPGSIQVTDGREYGFNTWYGRIDKSGNLTPGHALNDAVRDALRTLAVDPAGFASEYGRRTGSCCFCNRHLEDQRSVEVGYGPVCASHWNMPWGGNVEAMKAQLANA